jgi:hypothetical protein
MQGLLITIGILAALAGIGWCVLAWLRFTSDLARERELVFLQVMMPKKESKEDKETDSEQFSSGKDFKEVIGVMDHLYQSLHSLYNSKFNRYWKGQPYFSVEYAALAGEILFFIVCPRSIAHLIEKQVTAFYPDAILDSVEDYNIFTKKSIVFAELLGPTKHWHSSFKTYSHQKSDPLNSITNAFSKLGVDEGAAIQFILRPAKSGWQKKVEKEAQRLLNPKKRHGRSWWNPLFWVSAMFDLLTSSDAKLEDDEEKATGERVSQLHEEYSKTLDEKASNAGFEVTMRLLTSAETTNRAHQLMDGVVAAFTQFGSTLGNSFHHVHFVNRRKVVEHFIRRRARRTVPQYFLLHKILLGTSEMASFFHLPNIKYNKVETIKWQNYKMACGLGITRTAAIRRKFSLKMKIASVTSTSLVKRVRVNHPSFS